MSNRAIMRWSEAEIGAIYLHTKVNKLLRLVNRYADFDTKNSVTQRDLEEYYVFKPLHKDSEFEFTVQECDAFFLKLNSISTDYINKLQSKQQSTSKDSNGFKIQPGDYVLVDSVQLFYGKPAIGAVEKVTIKSPDGKTEYQVAFYEDTRATFGPSEITKLDKDEVLKNC